MAHNFVHVVATGRAASSTTTLTLTVAAGATVGNTVLVAAGGGGGSYVTSVTDSRGNTYVLDLATTTAPHTINVARTHVTTALQVGDTITLHYSLAITALVAIAYEYTGTLPTGAPNVIEHAYASSGYTGHISVSANSTQVCFWFSAWATASTGTNVVTVSAPFTRRALGGGPGALAAGADYTATNTTTRTVLWADTKHDGSTAAALIGYGSTTAGVAGVSVTAQRPTPLPPVTSYSKQYVLILTKPTGGYLDLSTYLVDGTAKVGRWSVTQQWGRQADTATLYLVDTHPAYTKSFVIPPMSTVTLYDTTIQRYLFGGIVDNPKLAWQSPNLDYWELNCHGYGTYLAKETVSYSSVAPKTTGAIVLTLMTNGGQAPPTGYDSWYGVRVASVTDGGYVTVTGGPILTRVTFTNTILQNALVALAQYASKTEVWATWVDEQRNLHFGPASITIGPVASFTDVVKTQGTVTTGHLQGGTGAAKMVAYEWDATDIRNAIRVSGTSASLSWTDRFSANSQTTQWTLSYVPDTSKLATTTTLTVGGVAQTLGTRSSTGSAPTTDYVLAQNTVGLWTLQLGLASTPSSGAIVLTYRYTQPITVQASAPYVTSGTNPYAGPNRGVFAEYISDTSITSTSAALARGNRELTEYQWHHERLSAAIGEDFIGHVRAGDVIRCTLSQIPDSQRAWAVGFTDLFVIVSLRLSPSSSGSHWRVYTVTAVRTFDSM